MPETRTTVDPRVNKESALAESELKSPKPKINNQHVAQTPRRFRLSYPISVLNCYTPGSAAAKQKSLPGKYSFIPGQSEP